MRIIDFDSEPISTQLCIELVQSNCSFESLPQRCSEEGVVGVGGDSEIHIYLCVAFMVRLKSRPMYSRVTLINLSATVDLKRNSLPPMYCLPFWFITMCAL